ncbi:MAG: tellurite resistance protein TerC, partial [Solirubrobacteraceae bacterium]|nr:tellurite resistance protein TerC [Solirubrobacteraceae bacterium]
MVLHVTDTERPPKPKLVEKLQERKEIHLQRSRWVRILYVLVGFTVLLGGLAMLVLPGPAFLVIPIGLAILALEFTWAEAMLERAIEQGEKAKQK